MATKQTIQAHDYLSEGFTLELLTNHQIHNQIQSLYARIGGLNAILKRDPDNEEIKYQRHAHMENLTRARQILRKRNETSLL